MKKFTPLALLCGLSLAVVGCDSVEEEQNETQNAVVDGLEDDGVIGEDDAEEIVEEQNETAEQVAEDADYDIDAEDGLGDGDIDLDPGAGNDIGEEDGIGDADGAEPVIGSDGL